MIRHLLSLICRWRGHRWSKPLFNAPRGEYCKFCRRCELVRAVKRRKPGATP